MRQTVDFSSAEFGLRTAESRARHERPDADKPFRVLVLGGFSGAIPAKELAAPVEIDPDNFDEVLERIGPTATLTLAGGETRLRFGSLDDFHPDALYRNVRAFGDPAREAFLRSQAIPDKPPPQAPPAAAPAQPYRPSSGSILDDMLSVQSGAAASSPAPARRDDPLDDVIRSIVKPHLTPAPDAAATSKARLGEAWDSALMRSILHHPAFRELEAAWRGLDFFIRRVPTGGDIRLAIVDVPFDQLRGDTAGLQRAFDSFGESYSLCVGLYDFGADAADMAALQQIGDMCTRANVPFVAGASPELLGQSSFENLAQTRKLTLAPEFAPLRQSEIAPYIGLALPRFLLRLPYGKSTSSIDSFDFSEMPDGPAHEDYLWGNPAIAVAAILAGAFEQGGWEGLMSSIDPEVDRLPVHTFGPSSGPEMTPCAECWMTDDLAIRLVDAGFLAFASLRHRDAMRLLRLQSISERSPRLRAPWAD